MKIADKIQLYQNDVDMGILIGCNCLRAIIPREVILGKRRSPLRSQDLTWYHWASHPTSTMFEADFSERHNITQAYSQEDRKFLAIVRDSSPWRWSLRDSPASEGANPKSSKQPLSCCMETEPAEKEVWVQQELQRRLHCLEHGLNMIQNGYAEKDLSKKCLPKKILRAANLVQVVSVKDRKAATLQTGRSGLSHTMGHTTRRNPTRFELSWIVPQSWKARP